MIRLRWPLLRNLLPKTPRPRFSPIPAMPFHQLKFHQLKHLLTTLRPNQRLTLRQVSTTKNRTMTLPTQNDAPVISSDSTESEPTPKTVNAVDTPAENDAPVKAPNGAKPAKRG